MLPLNISELQTADNSRRINQAKSFSKNRPLFGLKARAKIGQNRFFGGVVFTAEYGLGWNDRVLPRQCIAIRRPH